MMWISFSKTVDAFVAMQKTATRRYWKNVTISKFKKNDVVSVFDRIPIQGGKKIGVIRLIDDPFPQNTSMMTNIDYRKEGFYFMEQQDLLIDDMHPRVFFDHWKKMGDIVTVVEFEIIDVFL